MEDATQTGTPQTPGRDPSQQDSCDHALGAAIAECQQRLPTSNPRALRAALQDLLGSETLLSQPLRHLIDLPGFDQLCNETSPFIRETQSSALLRELGRFYQPHILNRISLVLHGYLGLPQPVISTARGDQTTEEAKNDEDRATEPTADRTETQPRDTADSFFKKGISAFKQNAYHQAIHWLNKGLAEEANHAEAYLQRGKAYLELNEHGSAMNDFNNAARLLPNDSEIYLQRGSLHQRMGAHDLARLDWGKAADLGNQQAARLLKQQQQNSKSPKHPDPRNPTSTTQAHTAQSHQKLFKRGAEELRQGNYEQADHVFTELLRLEPDHAAAYLERGKARSALLKDGAAMGDFDAAIRLDPKNAEAHAHRGILYAKLENSQKAKDDLLVALRLGHPQAGEWLTQQQLRLSQSHLKRGIEATNQGDYNQALKNFHAAIQTNEKDPKTYLQAGLSISQLGYHQEAIAWLSRCISINPRSSEAHLARGKARLAVNKHEKAIEDFTITISIDPQSADAYLSRARSYQALNRTDFARSDLLKASSMGASEATELLAELHRSQQRTDHPKASNTHSKPQTKESAKVIKAAGILTVTLASLWMAWEAMANQNWRPLGAAIGCGLVSNALRKRTNKQ